MTTVVPGAALAGLGWALVRQDRSHQAEARREQAAELGAAALTRTLTQLEDQLTTFAAGGAVARSTTDGLSLASFTQTDLIGRAGVSLPFYPGAPPVSDLPDTVAHADALELRDRNPSAALRVLEPLTSAENVSVRGEAWLRVGRLEKKAGRVAASLEAFDQLAALDQAIVDGQPAGLLGLQGRAFVLSAEGRRDDLSEYRGDPAARTGRRTTARVASDVRVRA